MPKKKSVDERLAEAIWGPEGFSAAPGLAGQWKPGLYRTEYDNTCIVKSRNPKRAWDMDQAEWIPIELVDPNSYIRPIEPGDLDRRMDE